MGFYAEDDIQPMLDEFGVDVAIGMVSVKGIQDQQGLVAIDSDVGAATDSAEIVIVKTGALPGLADGVEIVVDGIIYLVTNHQPIEDGALTRIDCGTK